MTDREQRTEEFIELRPLLFSIAYRILGSAAEAEDVVQEAWLRYASADAVVEAPRAFLTTVVTRLAVDVLRSARARREQYVGQWLPEPILTDDPDGPEARAELTESISMASLLLLERLTPLERAVFVLREVFDVDYAEIAEAVERSEDACRQLASRARRHMARQRPRFDADQHDRQALTERFMAAFREGDVEGLRRLLAAEVTMVGDGGGKAPSLPRPVAGREKVASLLASVGPPMVSIGVTLQLREVNGAPGLITRAEEGTIVNVVVIEVVDGHIQTIRSISNPDKLRHLGAVSDIWRLKDEFQKARRAAREESDTST
ncbi:RNA polymerase sigma-70 factor [Nesterenkonia xinjiangensis]|uniref:RNA polymerase sigma-70 factor (ECF subfamily) n=1 Tax=Nesterenkonia xinjiangensis TaxID=225327 RepID=A0A7Z0K9X6_9MICC|nr:RNA polymerase sigma-70 factor [Nesterenkonia xinjiangensis]NYJ77690.1 RNA polymerase sigma-70 factor (ECF subfamily) [Nesterenkonia xinjiangensis]